MNRNNVNLGRRQSTLDGHVSPTNLIFDSSFPDIRNEDRIYNSVLFTKIFLKEKIYANSKIELIDSMNIIERKFAFVQSLLRNALSVVHRNRRNEANNVAHVIRPILTNCLDYTIDHINEQVNLSDRGRSMVPDMVLSAYRFDNLFNLNDTDKRYMSTVIECKAINVDFGNVSIGSEHAEQVRTYLFHPSWHFKFGIWTNGIRWILFVKDKKFEESYIEFYLERIINLRHNNAIKYFFLFLILFRKKNTLDFYRVNNIPNNLFIYNLDQLCLDQMSKWEDVRVQFLNNNNIRIIKSHLESLIIFFLKYVDDKDSLIFFFNENEYRVDKQFICASSRKIYIYILFHFMMHHRQQHSINIQNNNTALNSIESYFNKEDKDLFNFLRLELFNIDRIISMFDNHLISFLKSIIFDKNKHNEHANLSDVVNNPLTHILENILSFSDKKSSNHYDFSSLDSEVLGKIYEATIGIIWDFPNQKMIWDSNSAKESGSFYSPRILVRDMVKGVFQTFLNNNNNNNNNNDNIFNLKIIDPAMGCGSFLIGCLQYMLEFIYSNQQNIQLPNNINNDKMLMKYILINCIYGVELYYYAVGLARASLFLEYGQEDQDILNALNAHLICGDSITGTITIDNNDNYIENYKSDFRIMCNEFELQNIDYKSFFQNQYNIKHPFIFSDKFPEVFNRGGFDIVIGNPPWKALRVVSPRYVENASQMPILEIYNRFIRERWSRTNPEVDGTSATVNLWFLFCILGFKILRGNGKMSFIVPQNLVASPTCAYIRDLLFSSGKLLKLFLLNEPNSKQLFPTVNQMTCIFLLKKNNNNNINQTFSIANGEIIKNELNNCISWTIIDTVDDNNIDFKEPIPKYPSAINIFLNVPTLGNISTNIISRGSPKTHETTLRRALLLVRAVSNNINISDMDEDGTIRVRYIDIINNNDRYVPAVKGRNIQLMKKILPPITTSDFIENTSNSKYRYYLDRNGTTFTNSRVEPRFCIALMNVKNSRSQRKICHTFIPAGYSVLNSCHVIRHQNEDILYLISGILCADFIDFYIRIHISNNNLTLDSIKMMPFFDIDTLNNLNFHNESLQNNLDIIINEKRNAVSDVLSFYSNENSNNNNNNSNSNNNTPNNNNVNYNEIDDENHVSNRYINIFISIKRLLSSNSISIIHNRNEMIVLIALLAKKLYHSNVEVDRFVYLILLNQCFNQIFNINIERLTLMYQALRIESRPILFIEDLLISLIDRQDQNGLSNSQHHDTSNSSDDDDDSDSENSNYHSKNNNSNTKQPSKNNIKINKQSISKKTTKKKSAK